MNRARLLTWGERVRSVIRAAVVVIALQFVFFGLLVISQGLPDRPIVSRLAEDVRGGSYGPPRTPDRMGGIGDTFTECVVVGTGLGPAPGESVLRQAGRMPRLSNCELGAEQILELDSGTPVQDSSYYKYWAGYSVSCAPSSPSPAWRGFASLLVPCSLWVSPSPGRP